MGDWAGPMVEPGTSVPEFRARAYVKRCKGETGRFINLNVNTILKCCNSRQLFCQAAGGKGKCRLMSVSVPVLTFSHRKCRRVPWSHQEKQSHMRWAQPVHHQTLHLPECPEALQSFLATQLTVLKGHVPVRCSDRQASATGGGRYLLFNLSLKRKSL